MLEVRAERAIAGTSQWPSGRSCPPLKLSHRSLVIEYADFGEATAYEDVAYAEST